MTQATADEGNEFRELSGHYEAIRLALLNDAIEDVAEHASAIEKGAQALANEFDAQAAGVPKPKAEDCRSLLPEISTAAARLASARDLDQAREAFFELSKPMGRYRKLAGVAGSVVVYCSMAKRAWIQPDGEIGNPYMGQGMASCGQVIAD